LGRERKNLAEVRDCGRGCVEVFKLKFGLGFWLGSMLEECCRGGRRNPGAALEKDIPRVLKLDDGLEMLLNSLAPGLSRFAG
jgi:hypothetical protein